MGVQFGRWNLDGHPVDRDYLEKVKAAIAPYGPDGGGYYATTDISILYRAFHTTPEAQDEKQPHIAEAGAVITWDGRLDNRAELIRQLPGALTSRSTDVSIVAAAYQKWGTDCFGKLIGDWALSIWDASSRSLMLAKDPIGTRHLYYSIHKCQVTWSTILDPLVLFAGTTFALCEEYIAGWLSFFPAAHLTPYGGIDAVPPSSFVLLRAGKQSVRKYWDFDAHKRITCSMDTEYEERFRTVLSEAVRRRLRSGSPVLAELSGGMDSSSIVCMADSLIARGSAETPRLDTVSYYNDSEPNWDERPYFTKVEEKLGRTGCHVDLAAQESFRLLLASRGFAATPGSLGGRPSGSMRQHDASMAAQGNRVVLSGMGGDEVTGGVPTPTPELQDLLTSGKFTRLAGQLKVWALNKKKPWFHLLLEAARGFLPYALVGVPKYQHPAPWLTTAFLQRNALASMGYGTRLKVFGPLPSIQSNLRVLEVLRRQLACIPTPLEPVSEKRYPYLDRDLLEFLYAIPREQLVRPGQRRSLMRRALVGIIPDEILNRKRKAFVSRAPVSNISKQWARVYELSENMISASLGVVDPNRFSQALQEARLGTEVPIVTLMRTLTMEIWLRCVRGSRTVDSKMSFTSERPRSFAEGSRQTGSSEFAS